MPVRKLILFSAGAALGLVTGCGGDARVELAAADALEAAAAQLRVAFDEYTAEIERADQNREAEAIAAFVARLQNDAGEASATESHKAAFTEALNALRTDMRTEWKRYGTSRENVQAVEEVAAGLRRVGIATLTVSDEVRRYLTGLAEKRTTKTEDREEHGS